MAESPWERYSDPGTLLPWPGMYRRGGIIALVIGFGLAYLWAFLPFSQELSRYALTDDGGWERAVISCPHPWAVLIEGELPQGEYRGEGEQCVRPARTLISGAVVAAIAGLALGVYGLTRGPAPPLVHIEPISELIEKLPGGKARRDRL